MKHEPNIVAAGELVFLAGWTVHFVNGRAVVERNRTAGRLVFDWRRRMFSFGPYRWVLGKQRGHEGLEAAGLAVINEYAPKGPPKAGWMRP